MTHSLGATLLQTNKSTPTGYLFLPVSSQLQLMPLYSVCESEKSMCNHIHTVFRRRHWGQTWNCDDPLCAERAQKYSNNFLSLFRLFHSVLIQNLSRLHSTEVTHFQSTRLVSQKKHLGLRRSLHGLIEWMCIAWALPPSTVAAARHHLLATVEKHFTVPSHNRKS